MCVKVVEIGKCLSCESGSWLWWCGTSGRKVRGWVFGEDGSVLAEEVETAEFGDRFEKHGIAACHVLQSMIWIRGVGDHFQIPATELCLSIVDRSRDTVEVSEEGFHPAPISSLNTRLAHSEDFFHTSELGSELCNA